jgi:hypothetical protein
MAKREEGGARKLEDGPQKNGKNLPSTRKTHLAYSSMDKFV